MGRIGGVDSWNCVANRSDVNAARKNRVVRTPLAEIAVSAADIAAVLKDDLDPRRELVVFISAAGLGDHCAASLGYHDLYS
jgi:hypothetical protein